MAHDELVLCDEGDFRFSEDTNDDDQAPPTERLDAPATFDAAVGTLEASPQATRRETLLPPPPARLRRVIIPPSIPVPMIGQYAQLSWLWHDTGRSTRSAPRPAPQKTEADRASSVTTKKKTTRKRSEPRKVA